MAIHDNTSLSRRRWLGATTLAGAATLARPHFARAFEPELPRQVLYYGEDRPPARLVELRAGALTALLDPERAFLRYLRVGGELALLGVYSAVRDRNWGTISPRVRGLKIEQARDRFEVSFEVDCIDGDIDFRWLGKIVGSAEEGISYRMNGEAHSTFLRNRIGFCVLHPIDCAGLACTVGKPDGSAEQSRFPDLIAPRQPFFDVRALTHEVSPGVRVEVRMEGAVFETEDQRNWTDASFKTYCTPLARPFPAEIKKGTKIAQMVRIRVHGAAKPAVVSSKPPDLTIETGEKKLPLPAIGIGLSASAPKLSEMERARVRSLYPDHLRVDLRCSKPGWQDQFGYAIAEAKAIGCPLEIAIFLGGDAEAQLKALAAQVKVLKPSIRHWLVLHEKEPSTEEKWMTLARKFLPGSVGSGTNANFTELNRGRPEKPGDVVCYSANPQVHAFDNLSLIETFAGLRDTVRTARSFAGDARIAVTPVTLKPRFNPVATASGKPAPNKLPRSVDPRQMSLFGAGWTLGALRALAESGVDSTTFYEAVGWRGVMESEAGSHLPAKFRSFPGSVFPLYHVLADVGEFSGGQVVPLRIPDPLRVAALLLESGDRRRLLAANLSSEVQYLRVSGAGLGSQLRIWRIDEHSVEQAIKSPEPFRRDPRRTVHSPGGIVEIALLPHAYVKIDPA